MILWSNAINTGWYTVCFLKQNVTLNDWRTKMNIKLLNISTTSLIFNPISFTFSLNRTPRLLGKTINTHYQLLQTSSRALPAASEWHRGPGDTRPPLSLMRSTVESDGGDDRRVGALQTMRPRLSQRRSRLRRCCVLEPHNASARSRKWHIPYPGSPSAGGKIAPLWKCICYPGGNKSCCCTMGQHGGLCGQK